MSGNLDGPVDPGTTARHGNPTATSSRSLHRAALREQPLV